MTLTNNRLKKSRPVEGKRKTGRTQKTLDRLTIDLDGQMFLGPRRVDLLEKIGELGSINRAAKELSMTYKNAWDAIDALNNLSHAPLVTSVRGGKKGGGATLTPEGLRYVKAYKIWKTVNSKLLTWWQEDVSGQTSYSEELSLQNLTRRIFFMKTSARNNFAGKVVEVTKGAVNSEVVIDIGAGVNVVAIITNSSVASLGLAVGSTAFALFKASSVILLSDKKMKTSARNRFHGTIKSITTGAVNTEVVIDLGQGKTVVAMITNHSATDLALVKEQSVIAIVKASSIIVATNE